METVARENASQLQALLLAEQPALESLARRLIWDPEEARDLAQSTVLSALGRWHQVRDPAAARAWLRRILVHRAISLLRKRRLWASLSSLFRVELEPPADPDETLGRKQHLSRLGAELARLPARQSAAFCLRYLEGFSLDEVAGSLGIEKGTARVHLQRAVRRLRQRGVLAGEST